MIERSVHNCRISTSFVSRSLGDFHCDCHYDCRMDCRIVVDIDFVVDFCNCTPCYCHNNYADNLKCFDNLNYYNSYSKCCSNSSYDLLVCRIYFRCCRIVFADFDSLHDCHCSCSGLAMLKLDHLGYHYFGLFVYSPVPCDLSIYSTYKAVLCFRFLELCLSPPL